MKKWLITVLLAGSCFVVHGQWEHLVSQSYWQNRASVNDAWETYSLINYDYDAYGNEVSYLQFLWGNGKQLTWRHTTSKYDAQQHLVNRLMLIYDLNNPGKLQTRRETRWTWNDGEVEEEITNEEDFVDGRKSFRRESGIWGEGVWEVERRTTYVNGDFYYSFSRYVFNAEGEVEQTNYINEDSQNGRTEFEERYYYTQEGCQSALVSGLREGTGNWVKQDSSSFVYDSECRLLKSEYYEFAGHWVLDFKQRFTYTFDSSDRLVRQVTEIRESGEWEILSEKSYSFDNAGKITLEYHRNRDFEERQTYTYSENYLVVESRSEGKDINEDVWKPYIRVRTRYDESGNTLFSGFWAYNGNTGMLDHVSLDSMVRNEAGDETLRWSYSQYENGNYQRKKTMNTYRCDGVFTGSTETILDALPAHTIGRQERYVIDYLWSPACAPTEFSEITIYPNPADNYLGIAFPEESEQWEVIITEMSGKRVIQEMVSGENQYLRIDTSRLKAGLYLLQLAGDAGSYTERFMIRH